MQPRTDFLVQRRAFAQELQQLWQDGGILLRRVGPFLHNDRDFPIPRLRTFTLFQECLAPNLKLVR